MPSPTLADRMFLVAEGTEIPQHVSCLGTFVKPEDAPPDFVQGLVDELREIRSVAPPLNFRLGNPRLKAVAPSYEIVADEDIDLDYHLRLDALPTPGSERQLGVLVSRLQSQPLDMSRPLWEFHLIDGLEGNRFALFFKVHHAVMDGVAGSQRLQAMVSPDPTDPELRPLWTVGLGERAARATPSTADRLNALAEAARTLAGLGKAATGMVADRNRGGDADLAVPYAVPKSLLNQRVGRQRRVATQNFEFERFRAVAKAGRVTHNDVFLAVCAGGLRRYLDEVGALPERALIAGTPVSVRTSGDDATNAFTMTVMGLATDVEAPLERLKAINRSSRKAKQRLSTMPPSVVKNYAALFMAPFLGANLVGLGGRTRPPYNVSISNVPGPVAPQYWAGARMEAMYPIGVLYHGVGLFIAALTVSGRVCVGFVGDRDSMPHLQRLAVYTGEAFDELERAVGGDAQ